MDHPNQQIIHPMQPKIKNNTGSEKKFKITNKKQTNKNSPKN